MTDSPIERRKGYAPTILIGLLAATAVTVGATRPWVSATSQVENLPLVQSTVGGAEVAPLAAALGVVLLAGFGAVLATSGWVRRAVGGLIVVAAAIVVYSAAAPAGSTAAVEDALAAKGWPGGAYDSSIVWWRWLVLTGGLLCAGAGVVIFRLGGQWATMGARYDAPTRPASGTTTGTAATADQTVSMSNADEAEVWRAIDRGYDPTQSP